MLYFNFKCVQDSPNTRLKQKEKAFLKFVCSFLNLVQDIVYVMCLILFHVSSSLRCRILVCDVWEVTMVQCCHYQINYWETVAAKCWQVEEKTVLFDYGPLTQVEKEGNMLWRLHSMDMKKLYVWCQFPGMSLSITVTCLSPMLCWKKCNDG